MILNALYLMERILAILNLINLYQDEALIIRFLFMNKNIQQP